jgi:hypothetical protein
MPHPSSITPDPLRAPTMAEIERARGMYAQGFTVARCLAAGNMSLGTFYYWLDGGPFLGPTTGKPAVGLGPTTDQSAVGLGPTPDGSGGGGRMLPPLPRRRSVLGKRRKPLAASHASLVARLYRTAERQALDIEQRLARPAGATPERDLRMLAQLVSALRGLTAIAPLEAPPAAAAAAKEDDNIDEFREVLARRLRGFIDARQREAEAAEQAAAVAAEAEPQRHEDKAGDIDEFREHLARRIHALIDQEQAREAEEARTEDEHTLRQPRFPSPLVGEGGERGAIASASRVRGLCLN